MTTKEPSLAWALFVWCLAEAAIIAFLILIFSVGLGFSWQVVVGLWLALGFAKGFLTS